MLWPHVALHILCAFYKRVAASYGDLSIELATYIKRARFSCRNRRVERVDHSNDGISFPFVKKFEQKDDLIRCDRSTF